MKQLLTIALTLSLAACGGGGGSSGTNTGGSSSSAATQVAYEVTALTATPGSVDPFIDQGNFSLSFSVRDNSQQFIATAYISTNETLSDSDVSFYTDICNTAVDCGQQSPFATDCFFTSENTVYCAGQEGDAGDISGILNTLPKAAFIILESCDSSTLNCDIATAPITFN